MFSAIYNNLFYDPLLNGLAFFIHHLPFNDVGLAIIALTIVVRIILFPLNHKAALAQKKMRELEPELKKIKEENKKNNQEQAKQIMELYRTHGVSPFNSIILLLIQIPIIFALYQVFLLGDKLPLADFYSFIPRLGEVSFIFLGILNLTQKSIILALITGLTQFYQMKLSIPPTVKDKSDTKGSFSADLNKTMAFQMRYIMPAFITIISFSLPSAITLYWTTMNLFAIIHEMIIRRKALKIQ